MEVGPSEVGIQLGAGFKSKAAALKRSGSERLEKVGINLAGMDQKDECK